MPKGTHKGGPVFDSTGWRQAIDGYKAAHGIKTDATFCRNLGIPAAHLSRVLRGNEAASRTVREAFLQAPELRELVASPPGSDLRQPARMLYGSEFARALRDLPEDCYEEATLHLLVGAPLNWESQDLIAAASEFVLESSNRLALYYLEPRAASASSLPLYAVHTCTLLDIRQWVDHLLRSASPPERATMLDRIEVLAVPSAPPHDFAALWADVIECQVFNPHVIFHLFVPKTLSPHLFVFATGADANYQGYAWFRSTPEVAHALWHFVSKMRAEPGFLESRRLASSLVASASFAAGSSPSTQTE